MPLTKYEQETIVNMNREDDYAVVYTRNARHIRAIQKDDRFEVVAEATDPETGELEGVTANISLDHFDPLTGLKRRVHLTEEQRLARGERLRLARAARKQGAE